MGQFASKALDGDPYIEIMRVLPDKELAWWIQKTIWLAEGFTLAEHFGRTYPHLFVFKCDHCNGAGAVTCPDCNGYKVKKASSFNGFRLSDQTDIGRLLAAAGTQECDHCGGYCQWDQESEWQGMWNEWEKKLAYYDRSNKTNMDDWHEDVMHKGRLDEDTAPAEEPEHEEGATGINVELDRSIKKIPHRLKALTSRFGGHPYDTFDMLPNHIIDPTIPLEENIERMGRDYNWVPPELDPQVNPELLLEGAGGALAQFEHQMRMEALLLNNLDAAMRDKPKPAQFLPTAGTVPCPECLGKPYTISFTPNVGKLFRVETPFWMRTLNRMSEMGTIQSIYQASSSRPWMRSDSSPSSSTTVEHPLSSFSRATYIAEKRSPLDEVPHQPPGDVVIQRALESSGPAWHYPLHSRPSLDATNEDPLALDSVWSRRPLEEGGSIKRNPITGDGPAEALAVYYALNPARNAARKMREERVKSSPTS